MTPHVLTPAPASAPIQAPSAPATRPARAKRRRRDDATRSLPAIGAPKLAIVGLGYVGLPTGLAATAVGLDVIGIDTSAARIDRIRSGDVDLLDRDLSRLDTATFTGKLILTRDPRELARADAVLICVPTPVHADHQPDLRALRAACETVVRHARAGQTLILTSTSYVGTTADLIVTPLTERGLRVGVDIHVAFSPERIDPGNTTHAQEDTPRVVGGATPACADRAACVLRHLTACVHRVSSMEAAELTKLYENTFRAVNIAFAYEMSDAAAHYGLDPIEVTRAAATKPFGFMAFYPGPGVGGHCIPCDPHYLLDPLRASGCQTPLIAGAMGAIADRPARVVKRACKLLGEPAGKRVLVAGVAYKPGVQDVRESPALEILGALERAGCEVAYHDPFVPELTLHGRTLHARQQVCGGDWDLIVVVTLHAGHEYDFLDDCALVLDGTYRASTSRRCHTV